MRDLEIAKPFPGSARSLRGAGAFTLVELLTVIGIIAILAAVVGPTLKNFRKGDSTLSATSQLLGAVSRARQLAISQRTTVYMVFVRSNFWDGYNNTPVAAFAAALTNVSDLMAASNLVERQLTGYTFVALRRVGDQPGQRTPRYLSAWQTLPDGTFIAPWKFIPGDNKTNRVVTDQVTGQNYGVRGFSTNDLIPFPSENAPYVPQPYIAFDYQGRLVSGRDEFIPLAQGSVSVGRDANKAPILADVGPIATESPAGNSTNSFNLIRVDWLTGRARLEHQEVQ